eukprot:Anaeramoba_ignava/a357225_92.p1 GENE.a357225_92~~a357225_92.p1  ORF type:complete len:277 (+),score=100.04 a357225_92:19-849(+)
MNKPQFHYKGEVTEISKEKNFEDFAKQIKLNLGKEQEEQKIFQSQLSDGYSLKDAIPKNNGLEVLFTPEIAILHTKYLWEEEIKNIEKKANSLKANRKKKLEKTIDQIKASKLKEKNNILEKKLKELTNQEHIRSGLKNNIEQDKIENPNRSDEEKQQLLKLEKLSKEEFDRKLEDLKKESEDLDKQTKKVKEQIQELKRTNFFPQPKGENVNPLVRHMCMLFQDHENADFKTEISDSRPKGLVFTAFKNKPSSKNITDLHHIPKKYFDMENAIKF